MRPRPPSSFGHGSPIHPARPSARGHLARVAVGEQALAPPLGIRLEQRAEAFAERGRLLAERQLLGREPRSTTDPRTRSDVEFLACARWSTGAPGSRSPTACGSRRGSGFPTSGRPRWSSRRSRTGWTTSRRRTRRSTSASARREGFAVARVDLRGTGSSEGLRGRRVPAAGAGRPRSRRSPGSPSRTGATGRVGMYGTSYSGFNSIQLAIERPPALGAICAIYATDDRYTDDVHYTGGALRATRPRRLRPLHGGDERAPAGAGGLRRRVARRVAAAGSRARSRGSCAGSRSRSTGRTGATGRSGPATSASSARR